MDTGLRCTWPSPFVVAARGLGERAGEGGGGGRGEGRGGSKRGRKEVMGGGGGREQGEEAPRDGRPSFFFCPSVSRHHPLSGRKKKKKKNPSHLCFA